MLVVFCDGKDVCSHLIEHFCRITRNLVFGVSTTGAYAFAFACLWRYTCWRSPSSFFPVIWTVVAEAAGDDGQERVLLFNTRGLAVSMSATGALFLPP